MRTIKALAILVGFALPQVSQAQGTNIAFGGLQHDATLPVEVAADSLRVDQSDGTALFTGNVRVSQGEMRLASESLRVEYAEDGSAGQINRMIAKGGVTFTNGLEAAESLEAIYTLSSSSVVMIGNVILTQGLNAISGDRLVIDLDAGTGDMEGRVRTVFRPAGDEEVEN